MHAVELLCGVHMHDYTRCGVEFCRAIGECVSTGVLVQYLCGAAADRGVAPRLDCHSPRHSLKSRDFVAQSRHQRCNQHVHEGGCSGRVRGTQMMHGTPAMHSGADCNTCMRPAPCVH